MLSSFLSLTKAKESIKIRFPKWELHFLQQKKLAQVLDWLYATALPIAMGQPSISYPATLVRRAAFLFLFLKRHKKNRQPRVYGYVCFFCFWRHLLFLLYASVFFNNVDYTFKSLAIFPPST